MTLTEQLAAAERLDELLRESLVLSQRLEREPELHVSAAKCGDSLKVARTWAADLVAQVDYEIHGEPTQAT